MNRRPVEARAEIVARLRGKVDRGEPILGGGAGNGPVGGMRRRTVASTSW